MNFEMISPMIAAIIPPITSPIIKEVMMITKLTMVNGGNNLTLLSAFKRGTNKFPKVVKMIESK